MVWRPVLWGGERKTDGFKIKVKKGEQVKRECEQCLRKDERKKRSKPHSLSQGVK